MTDNRLVAPFLKWAGGKRQIIPQIVAALPDDFSQLHYFEPFVGGGALLFHLRPSRAVINDYNAELINLYNVIKAQPGPLIDALKIHRNEAEYYYQIRALDRDDNYGRLTDVERASRIVYLNKTCYNGLYRVNSAGKFNVPFGRYKNPNIVNQTTIEAVSRYLNDNDIQILNGDFDRVLQMADSHSFVYLDPPYHPLSPSSSFTSYVGGGWGEAEQIRLREACDGLTRRGVRFLLSNSSAPFIKEQYRHYHQQTVKAGRALNSDATKRGVVDELLICNYR